MTATVSKAGPYYSSGEIKFSSLRSNFRSQVRKETSSGSETFSSDTAQIKASDLRRITTTSNSNPIVPDATENASITTTSNWKTSQFRGSIKYFYITQSGTDTNFDIDAQSWNNNLSKNIRKFLFVDGTCGSSSASSPAAQLSATAYNLTVDVYGSILGAAGRGGGTAGAPDPSGEVGGDALEMTSPSGSNNIVLVRTGSRIYAGGGGGERGTTGSNGSGGTCYEYYYINQCSGGAPSCAGGWTQISSGWGCCEWRRGCAVARWTRTCQRTYPTSGGTGGTGGSGGLGRGYNNQSGSLSGVAGSAGTAGGGCGATNGGDGENGASGGDWANSGGNTNNSGSGGAAGRAVFGSNYTTSGPFNDSSIVKGVYT